jgi:hypothetical protein
MEVDIETLLSEILKVAIENSTPASEIPNSILILTNVNLYKGMRGVDSLSENSVILEDYKKAGYKVPCIIFWNLRNLDVVATDPCKNGIAFIIGVNPSTLTSLLLTSIEGLNCGDHNKYREWVLPSNEHI